MGSHNSKRKLPHELSVEQLELIKSKTNLPTHEICRWYNEFYQFANGKQLNQNDFVKYFKEILPYDGKSEDFCRLAFNVFDSEKSDQIDFKEIILGFTILASPDLQQRLKWMFKFYDQNNDGFIDKQELKTAIKAILKMKDTNLDTSDEILNELADKIKNGLTDEKNEAISLDEFIDGTLNNQFLRDILCPKHI